MTSYSMNADHRDSCPCYHCFKVGDKVLVYVDRMGEGEEIVTNITEVNSRANTHPIVVNWPGYNDGEGMDDWSISINPKLSKEECRGFGKLIRKATKEDLARQ